jgi:hypothetical protein
VKTQSPLTSLGMTTLRGLVARLKPFPSRILSGEGSARPKQSDLLGLGGKYRDPSLGVARFCERLRCLRMTIQ